MQYFEIPLRSDIPNYSQKVTLDDVVYTLAFRYNARMTRWVMDISLSAGDALLVGVPLIQGMPLTYRFIGRLENFPPGQFWIIDETEKGRDPDRDTLGQDIKLIYTTGD